MFSRLEDFRFARWVKSLNRSLQILFSLTLVATLNILAATHFHRWDLTANRRFSLGPETLSYLSKIPHNTPVQISLILPENQADDANRAILDQNRTLLKEYVYEAAHMAGGAVPLTYEEIDPLREGDKLKALGDLGYTRRPATQIMVVCGKRGHAITTADLYDSSANRASNGGTAIELTAFKGENAVTSAILDVIQAKPDQIFFTAGHGEMSITDLSPDTGLSNLGVYLKNRNYSFGALNLSIDNIPDEAKLVVLASPTVPVQPYEVEKLRRYLNDKNGRVMIFLEPGRKNGLDALLEEWGLRSNDWTIADPQYLTNDRQMAIDPASDTKRIHKLTEPLILNGLAVVFGATRPVVIDDKAPADDRRQVHEFLTTSKNSYAARTEDVNMHDAPTFEGPFAVAALSERGVSEGVNLPGGRLLVFGNADFIANQNFNNYGNPQLILNCVNYLANHENMLNIPPRAPHQTKLDITTTAQFTGLAWRLAVVPALVALLGIVVFWVRNRT